MIYLLLSILSSTLIFVLFKLFNTYKVDTFQAIVINYFVACAIGITIQHGTVNINNIIHAEWFYGAIVLGFLFILIFNVMAITAQRNGLSVASVASKMSVIIPVIFGIYVYNESTGFQKILGIILALFAVYLASVKSKSKLNFKKNLIFPVILFFGSGIIDTSIKYFAPEDGIPIFSATIFSLAGCIGLLIILQKIIKKTFKFNPLSVIGGIVLGIINFGSMYYLLKALNHKSLESSTLFTLNNVGVLTLSALIGFVIFKEKLSTKNWIGIGLAIVSILIVTLA